MVWKNSHVYVSDSYFIFTRRTTSPEEMQEKYERILSSAILCLRLIIQMCPADKLSDLSEKCSTVLEQAAFWKFPNHACRMVALYSVNHFNSLCCTHLEQNFNNPVCILSVQIGTRVILYRNH